MKERFMKFFMAHSFDKDYPEQLWKKIEEAYSAPERYYHTLTHLAKMLDTIAAFENRLHDKDALIVAVWFHDVIYDTARNDNEEKSAEFLVQESKHFTMSESTIQKAAELILLTRKHVLASDADFDAKLFLDADLVVLGGTEEEYRVYREGVRKEYKQYSDLLYNEGRKKVLKRFLESESLYKTEEMRERFEKKAKMNLSLELKHLS